MVLRKIKPYWHAFWLFTLKTNFDILDWEIYFKPFQSRNEKYIARIRLKSIVCCDINSKPDKKLIHVTETWASDKHLDRSFLLSHFRQQQTLLDRSKCAADIYTNKTCCFLACLMHFILQYCLLCLSNQIITWTSQQHYLLYGEDILASVSINYTIYVF